MMNPSRQKTLTLGVMALVILVAAPAVFAGEYHFNTSTTLNCTSCHIMHTTKEGVATPGNGFPALINKATINELCSGCHGLSSATSNNPDVYSAGTVAAPTLAVGNGYPSVYGASAGCFQSDASTTPSPFGHDLAGGAVTAPGGTWTSAATGMTCTDCHDPHANANYRNMRTRPAGVSSDILVRVGTSGTKEVYEQTAVLVPKSSAGIKAAYDSDNIAFADAGAVVTWCTSCHTNITDGDKHPNNRAISGSDVDSAHWVAGTGTGFGTAVGDATAGIPRVRFTQSGASYADCKTVATTNRVFCLTCHKAHGSAYDSTLVWPYYTDGAADRTSACGQCHNSGA